MKNITNQQININLLNDYVTSSKSELVKFSEEFYDNQLNQAVELIKGNSKCSFLLISGPSASSKTTTAQKLSDKLKAASIHSAVISLDNFFVNRDVLPILPNGEVDFESINTLDMETLKRCFNELITDKKSKFPIFDFSTGSRSNETIDIEITDNSILIVEGIHALNPLIAEGLDQSKFLRIYVSPESDYCLNDEIKLSSKDVRLIRRIIRDYFYRNNPVHSTLDMWVNVVKSEQENIIPFKTQADFIINSSIFYEINLFKKYFFNILKNSPVDYPYTQKIDSIKNALELFIDIETEFVPSTTVLSEFINWKYLL